MLLGRRSPDEQMGVNCGEGEGTTGEERGDTKWWKYACNMLKMSYSYYYVFNKTNCITINKSMFMHSRSLFIAFIYRQIIIATQHTRILCARTYDT